MPFEYTWTRDINRTDRTIESITANIAIIATQMSTIGTGIIMTTIGMTTIEISNRLEFDVRGNGGLRIDLHPELIGQFTSSSNSWFGLGKKLKI